MVNPWPKGKDARKKGKQQERLPLSREQVQTLLEILIEHDGPHPKEMPVAVLLGLFAGMRLADAVLLDWEGVDLRGGWITYTPRKTSQTSGAVCTVPILPPLAEALRTLPKKGEKVLPDLATHYQKSKDYVTRLLGALVLQATGNERQDVEAQHQRARRLYGFHSLRHSFCSEAAKAGVSAGMLKAMSGDNLGTLDRFYARGKNMATAPQVEFQPLPRLLERGTSGTVAERAELHRLADELSLADVKDVLAYAVKKKPLGERANEVDKKQLTQV
jgi:integrase